MGTLDSIAVGAAEHIERSFGPFAALRAFQALVPKSPASGDDADLAARATLGTIRCAIQAREQGAAEQGARAWVFCGPGDRFREVVELVGKLERAPYRTAALLLASSEAQRAPTAGSFYLRGRTAEGAGALPVAIGAYEQASERDAESAPGRAARLRLAALLAAKGDARAAELVRGASTEGLGGDAALLVASLSLSQPSKFARASALSSLEEIAREALSSDPARRARARTAIRMAAAHADARPLGLSAVEADRVAACLKHWPAKEGRERAAALLVGLVRLSASKGAARERLLLEIAERDADAAPAAEQARALLSGATHVGEGLESPSACGIRGIGAIDRDRSELVAESLGAVPAHAVTPSVWTCVLLALGRADTAKSATALAAAIVARGGPAPPRGWVSLASALARSPDEGARDLTAEALELAGAAGEATVLPALRARWVRRAWTKATAGQRAEAIALLRKARGAP